jgi:hypothetical protein
LFPVTLIFIWRRRGSVSDIQWTLHGNGSNIPHKGYDISKSEPGNIEVFHDISLGITGGLREHPSKETFTEISISVVY